MVEVAPRGVLGVVPVVRLLHHQLGQAEVGQPQREQVRGEPDRRDPPAAVRAGFARGEDPEGVAQVVDDCGNADRGDERKQRWPAEPLGERAEHAAPQKKCHRRHREEAEQPTHVDRVRLTKGRRERPPRVEHVVQEEGHQEAQHMSGPGFDAQADGRREHRQVHPHAQQPDRGEAAAGLRRHRAAGQHAQPVEIGQHLPGPELALAARPVGEADRHLRHPEALGRVRHQLQADLVAVGRGGHPQQPPPVHREEARHRVGEVGDGPGQRRRHPGGDPPLQRPAHDAPAAGVAASDDEVGPFVELPLEQRRHRLGRVREVGVHHHDRLRPRRLRARPHRATKAAGGITRQQPNRSVSRPGMDAVAGAVGGAVVDDDHLRLVRQPLRVQCGEQAIQQRVDVVGFVQRRDDDAEPNGGILHPDTVWASA